MTDFYARARWGSRWAVVDKFHPSPHKGLDLVQPAGTVIPVLRSGRVVARGYSSAVGNYVTVQVAANDFDTYTHLVNGAPVGAELTATVDGVGHVAGYNDKHGSSWTGPHTHLCRSTTVRGWAVWGPANLNPEPLVLDRLSNRGSATLTEEVRTATDMTVRLILATHLSKGGVNCYLRGYTGTGMVEDSQYSQAQANRAAEIIGAPTLVVNSAAELAALQVVLKSLPGSESPAVTGLATKADVDAAAEKVITVVPAAVIVEQKKPGN